MLKSMTGFGKASGSVQSLKISVEIRSLNSKTLDLNVRMAGVLKELEPKIRKLISKELNRGKVDLSISAEFEGENAPIQINTKLAASYYQQLNEMNTSLGIKTEDYTSHILRMPEIYISNKEDLTKESQDNILALVKTACNDLNTFRTKEGEDLKAEFTDRINEIRSNLGEVTQYEQVRIDTIKERIKSGLEEISSNTTYDENRLEQEMIFYIEKLDIAEEKMRLSNHLDYFEKTMVEEFSGKKLGFISQEIGREINTLGSKSNHADMQKHVIDMKDSLEKIKEQILNTL